MYLDPPYNTEATQKDGNNLANDKENVSASKFIYRDKFSRNGWLNMIRERLVKARTILKDDGVIFVSIDDAEQAYLKVLMDEIFGEENFVANITIINNLGGRSDQKHISQASEYLLIYAKNISKIKFNGKKIESQEIEKKFNLEDSQGSFKLIDLKKGGSESKREDRPFMFYPIIVKNDEVFSIKEEEYNNLYDKKENKFNDEYLENLKRKYQSLGYKFILPLYKTDEFGRWRVGFKSFKERLSSIKFKKETNSIMEKVRPTLENGDLKLPNYKSIWYQPSYDSGSSTTFLNSILDNSSIFNFPKSIHLIKDVIRLHTNKSARVLDFFAGSGTTAHAVWDLNREDGGNRSVTIVTNNENDIAKNVTYERLHRISLGKATNGDSNFKWLNKNEPYQVPLKVYETKQFPIDINESLNDKINLFIQEIADLANVNLDENEEKQRILYYLKQLYSLKNEEDQNEAN
nr:site-specific DNA-methyltransferase [Mycoplasmopsis pullorum]